MTGRITIQEKKGVSLKGRREKLQTATCLGGQQESIGMCTFSAAWDRDKPATFFVPYWMENAVVI